jgi:DNA-directed RNA polymerase beta subunit
MSKRVEVMVGKDARGEPEELTWDLFPVVDARLTLHLDTHGLPKIGTRILPGMILVGKIGTTELYDPKKKPNALEIHALPFEELRARFGAMWRDSSLYADDETSGIVKSAYIEDHDGRQKAVVILE